jgi:hypothetical protein
VTIPLPVGPLTPYVTPELLTQASTGISWSTIPPGRSVSDQQRYDEQLNICMRATAQVDTYCNQPLRATLDTELQSGPDFRLTVQNQTGNARLILQRWPVLSILSVQVSPNSFPRRWTTVPVGMYDVEHPVIGLFGTAAPSAAGEGGQSILIAAGFVSWCLGRNGFWVKTQYVNGWPHASLTQTSHAGDQVLHVDDCTGWAVTSETLGTTGVTGVVYDGGAQEVAQATATSVTSGPGTVNLAAPLTYPHAAGVLYSSLPASVMWATIQYGAAQALTRGATATTVQSIPGGGGNTGGAKGPADLAGEAELLLDPFRRVI